MKRTLKRGLNQYLKLLKGKRLSPVEFALYFVLVGLGAGWRFLCPCSVSLVGCQVLQRELGQHHFDSGETARGKVGDQLADFCYRPWVIPRIGVRIDNTRLWLDDCWPAI